MPPPKLQRQLDEAFIDVPVKVVAVGVVMGIAGTLLGKASHGA